MAKRKATGRKRKAARKTPSRPRKTTRRAASRRAPRPHQLQENQQRPQNSNEIARQKDRSPGRHAKPEARLARPRSPAHRGRPSGRPQLAARPKPVALDRERRRLTEDITLTSAPSTLGYEPKASSAESGHQAYHHRQREHTEGGSALTGGDVDTDWNDAYSSGEETPGGDMPTPDQDVVEEIGRALGVEYEDAEELKGAPKIEERDRHRWEYDPASAEDYKDRNRRDDEVRGGSPTLDRHFREAIYS